MVVAPGGSLVELEEALVQAGELLGDRRRIRILMALAGGEAWPAGELARAAGIQPATASHHLERLVAGGLLAVVPQGRHRYYRLASPAAAALLESLAVLAPPSAPHSWRGARQRDALKAGRTCYDHLAGQLGVAWAHACEANGWVERAAEGYVLTAEGAEWLAGLHIEARAGAVIRQHAVDWTERQPHLAGPLAKAITQRLFDRGWIERGPLPRSVCVTPAGREQLAAWGVRLGRACGPPTGPLQF